MNCKPHNNPANWKAVEIKRRGWERIVCAKCGKFVGYRPKDGK